MKLELIAITITLSSQPDLGMFSHHWDLHEIQFLCSSLHLLPWHSAKQSYYFDAGKKVEAQKTLRTSSKVLRSLTNQEIEASPSDHELDAPVMSCLCSADGTCTSHSCKHHQVREKLKMLKMLFMQHSHTVRNLAKKCFPCLAASQARSEAHLYWQPHCKSQRL